MKPALAPKSPPNARRRQSKTANDLWHILPRWWLNYAEADQKRQDNIARR
jgi:hypothetical protein